MTSHIGPRLRELRIQCGLSQGDLAIKSGVNQNAISHAERNESRLRPDNFARILTALDCSLLYFNRTIATPENKLTWKPLRKKK